MSADPTSVTTLPTARFRRAAQVTILATRRSRSGFWPGEPCAAGRDLLRAFAETAARRRWLEYTPGRDRLPDADHARLSRSSAA
ncbi:hypothetical protein [Frankia sp. QA3]|uniref:hypothetical protein n=1 Tax=Frankia sp. QA3 TaxID=710111 RepID=UPI0002DF61AA|nr:hypothetical protein [Frankia sp. QA3]